MNNVALLKPRPMSTPYSRQTSDTGVTVALRNITKSFGETKVLDGVSITIAPGEFVAIVGRSGCGKSTLLRLLAGLDTATSGTVAVDENPLERFSGKVRMMFQDARLLPWKRTIENVGVGQKGNWRDVAQAALSEVGLANRARDWPAVLSGGQRQRVALARALVSQPRLLLLDEPLGALDALTRIEMQELVEQVWSRQGFTAILVTHDVAEAVSLADRVIMIDRGKVALDVSIDLPRPRSRSNPAFARLEGRILERILDKE